MEKQFDLILGDSYLFPVFSFIKSDAFGTTSRDEARRSRKRRGISEQVD